MAAYPDPAWQADLARRTTINIVEGFQDALLGATAETARMAIEIGRILEAGVAPTEFARAHEQLAKRAQQSILRSYDQTVTRRKGSAGRYRAGGPGPNRRYAGGALRSALAAPDMVSWNEHGMALVNVHRLDREAAHWARLNAGALPAGRGSRRSFQVRFSNLVIGAIGVDMAPSEPFFIPRGYWWRAGEGPYAPDPGRRGEDQFYPIGTGPGGRASGSMRRRRIAEQAGSTTVRYQRRRPTRGIQARNFLDAGAATVARELGPTYQRLYQDLFNKRIGKVRPRAVTTGVRTFRGGY